MLNIINDIVDIAKIESGQMEVSLSETSINKQVEYVHTFFKPEAEKKGLEFTFKNTLPSNEATIQTDREKIYAILTNLVKNAIKFTNEGMIEFGYNLQTDRGSPWLEFFVKDTGIGIPANRQEAIFERFIQADISDKSAYQGAGLGLSITKSYVEMLGGKIWVESRPGEGSVFYFTIPYRQGAETKPSFKGAAVIAGVTPMLNKLKILIAEDDETSDDYLSTIISIYSTDIYRAATGGEAVEICRSNPDLDLILMDIRMPGISGDEATRQIREFNREVVIIAQTAYGLSGDRERFLEAGCTDYISKPIDRELLTGLIEKHLGSRLNRDNPRG